jgi:ATP-dependent helicase/nuclease subunit B
MLWLIGLHEDLVERTAREILEHRNGNDLSSVAVVFPNKRFGYFLRQELSAKMPGNFFPPAMYPVEAFFQSLFKLNFPGFKVLEDLEAAHTLYESARSVFPAGMYGNREIGDFPSFQPWARKVLAALEEILGEDGQLQDINWGEFSEFAGLGEYHKSYKAFIQGIPALLDDFQRRLRGQRQATMGIVYRDVAVLAANGMLETPREQSWIFSGFNALNTCERKLFHFFLEEHHAGLIMRTDPLALSDPNSPFSLQARTIRDLGLEQPPHDFPSRAWNDLAGRVSIHSCDGVESEVFQAFRILQEICRGRDETALRKVAVLLPSSPTLIPFVQGAISRFDQENDHMPFNITLGYPLERTPMMQLVDSLLALLENSCTGAIEASDYLQVIRHPYVKVSGADSDLEPLKRGIHLLENIIGEQNLIRFSRHDLEDKLAAALGKSIADKELAFAIKAQVDALHQRFIPPRTMDISTLLVFMRRALESVCSESSRQAYLFLNEYAAAALKALAELEDFVAPRKEAFVAADTASLAALVRSHFHGRTIGFEGTPLKGIQVMGPLEFRGLSFDEVVILDAVEGILPGTKKYDPILPADIRHIFKIRDHGDWEKIYAFNFFSLLGAAGRVHILYSRKSESGQDCERSRFIERIVYEVEKRTGRAPQTQSAPLPFSIPARELKKVIKNQAVQDKLESLVLSPSSLEAYVRCPLQFYFRKILGLQERQEIIAETEGGLIGTIAHKTLAAFYDKYKNADQMAFVKPKTLANDLENFLHAAFRELNFDPDKGLEKIRAWTMKERLLKFIGEDQERMAEALIQVDAHEKKLSGEIRVPWRPAPVPFTVRIDRCESQGQVLRVIDYKTGSFNLSPDNMLKATFSGADLTGSDESTYLLALNDFRNKYQGMQLLIYILLLAQVEGKTWDQLDGAYVLLRNKEKFLRPLFFRNRGREEMGLEEKTAVMEIFISDLGKVLNSLYSRNSFLANPGDESYCSYCPFRLPCGNL